MARRRGRIIVAAGTNGAGKSSIVGSYLQAAGQGFFFNPDALAQRLRGRGKSQTEANAMAWTFGLEALQRAVARNEDFAFETTLGGTSIVRTLHQAIEHGMDVRIFYFGLASPELHIARVRARVTRGGHDIPEAKIRERYPLSLANLVSLIGKAAQVHLFDNSTETETGLPASQLILRMNRTRILEPDLPALVLQTPEWAKPIVAAALRVESRQVGARAKK
jgi:predicted ABC-type ATPase